MIDGKACAYAQYISAFSGFPCITCVVEIKTKATVPLINVGRIIRCISAYDFNKSESVSGRFKICRIFNCKTRRNSYFRIAVPRSCGNRRRERNFNL